MATYLHGLSESRRQAEVAQRRGDRIAFGELKLSLSWSVYLKLGPGVIADEKGISEEESHTSNRGRLVLDRRPCVYNQPQADVWGVISRIPGLESEFRGPIILAEADPRGSSDEGLTLGLNDKLKLTRALWRGVEIAVEPQAGHSTRRPIRCDRNHEVTALKAVSLLRF